MKKITFSFLAMSLACCSSCISSSSKVLTQKYIDSVTKNPTGESILALGEALKPLKKSGKNQQMYWAGLRALTVLSGDGWLEAQQALAYVHDSSMIHSSVEVIRSAKEFMNRKKELLDDSQKIDDSYINKIVKGRLFKINDCNSKEEQKRFMAIYRISPERRSSIPFAELSADGHVSSCYGNAGFPIRADMIGLYEGGLTWAQQVKGVCEYGWKIHVSAWPSSVEKITSIVMDCIEEIGEDEVDYKIPLTPSMLRRLNFQARYRSEVSQRGKAITIYPKNDKQAREIVEILDKKLKEALRERELAPDSFCPLTGEYQVGTTGGIFARLCFYNEEGGDVRRKPEIRDDIAQAHVRNESDRNVDIISKKLNENELEKYKALIQEQKVLRKKLDSLLPKKKGLAPRIIPLGGDANQCQCKLMNVEFEIEKIERKVKDRIALDYVKKEVQDQKVSVENYSHPFKNFPVSLYGHVFDDGPVANWPSVGEDGDGDLAALTRTIRRE